MAAAAFSVSGGCIDRLRAPVPARGTGASGRTCAPRHALALARRSEGGRATSARMEWSRGGMSRRVTCSASLNEKASELGGGAEASGPERGASDPSPAQGAGSEDIVEPSQSLNSFAEEEPKKDRKVESVVGVPEGLPQGVIDAERKANPLRRWRLAVYALAASVAGAQAMDTCLKIRANGVGDSVGSVVLIDVLVILMGAGLWRVELFNRANNLVRIWKEAEFRAESLRKAEAGEGDTLWTARVRGLKIPSKR
eukprot:1180796-Prorocentrum_minimum.AAC.4